jgi:hypothetical protein
MERFIKNFHRNPFGVWVCVSQAEMTLPEGRIQVTVGSRFAKGTKFMNVDLAALLEHQYWKEQGGHPS